MAEIKWTNEAVVWLEDIHKYIANDNPVAANRVAEGIYNKVQVLIDFPEIGYLYRSEPEGDIRVLLYGHYRIAYLYKKNTVIEILGVFHGALDMERYF